MAVFEGFFPDKTVLCDWKDDIPSQFFDERHKGSADGFSLIQKTEVGNEKRNSN
jgi:hypothetical protein